MILFLGSGCRCGDFADVGPAAVRHANVERERRSMAGEGGGAIPGLTTQM